MLITGTGRFGNANGYDYFCTMIKLTVITITYNNLAGLRKTADSVLAQTMSDFEWIIVDGASTDGTQAYLQEIPRRWQGAAECLQIISEPDTGIYNAMNKGIFHAHGTYLQFLNSGDSQISPTILEQIFSNNPTADILYGNRMDVYANGDLREVRYAPKISIYFLWSSMISHQASFIRRALFDTVGLYREDLKYASDWVFFLKAFVQHNASSMFLDMPIVYFDKGGISSDVANTVEMKAERKRAFAETLPYLEDDFENMHHYIEMLRLYDPKANALGKKLLRLPRKVYRFCKRMCKKLHRTT